MPKPAPIPIFRYVVTMKDASTRECHAMQYALDGEWLQFDAPTGTVLSLRAELVQEVMREPEPVAQQEVDVL